MAKAIVFLAEGFEEVEALTVVDYLRRARVEVTTVKVPTGEKIKGNAERMVVSSHRVPVIADETLDECAAKCKKALPDCVYAPGGMPGSLNLAATKQVLSIIQQCFDEGKIVAAICAAPAVVLSKTSVLKGKKWTCYPGMEKDADKEGTQGSTHVDNQPFVTDGNVVTGRGAGCAEQLAMELARILAGESEAERVHNASVQR